MCNGVARRGEKEEVFHCLEREFGVRSFNDTPSADEEKTEKNK